VTLTMSSGKTASLAIRPPQGMPSRRDQHVAMLKPPEKVDQPTGPYQRCSASCHDEVAVIDFFGVGFAVFGVVWDQIRARNRLRTTAYAFSASNAIPGRSRSATSPA